MQTSSRGLGKGEIKIISEIKEGLANSFPALVHVPRILFFWETYPHDDIEHMRWLEEKLTFPVINFILPHATLILDKPIDSLLLEQAKVMIEKQLPK